MNTSLLIVDHRQVVCAGLRSFLTRSRIDIAGEAQRGKDAVKLARKLSPDVVLIGEPQEETALVTLRRFRRSLPELPVLMCWTDENPTYQVRSLAMGASGCLSMESNRNHITSLVRQVASGGSAWTDEQVHRFTSVPPPLTGEEVHLTPRERQVLRQLAYGLPNREIAELLDISVETVKEHVASIRQKLGFNDRTRAAVWAIRKGLD